MVLTSGARTAPALLLAEDPEAEPAPSTLGLSSVTQNSRGGAALLERTRMLLYRSGAPEAVPCTPACASTWIPSSSSLTPTRIPLAPGLMALPAASHLLPLLLNQTPASLQWVLNEGNTSPIPTCWEPKQQPALLGVWVPVLLLLHQSALQT